MKTRTARLISVFVMASVLAAIPVNAQCWGGCRRGWAWHGAGCQGANCWSSSSQKGRVYDPSQGAGIQASQMLAGQGVQAVITGHVGPKAWSALQAANIQVFAVTGGTAEQAVQAFLAGQLRAASQPDVRGHW